MSYFIAKHEPDLYIPASSLDRVLVNNSHPASSTVKYKIYNILTGEQLHNKQDERLMINQLIDNLPHQIYSTTDHLPYSVEVNSAKFIYMSLDSSDRTNFANCSFYHTRLQQFTRVLNRIIEQEGGGDNCFVVFSESCCPSFQGATRTQPTEWITIRNAIAEQTGLFLIAEHKNNYRDRGAFGLSFWALSSRPNIASYIPRNIWEERFGSVTLGIELPTREFVWFVHFPFDLATQGEANPAHIAMKTLISVMEEYEGSICAIGDMNTIPGMQESLIEAAVVNKEKYTFLMKDVMTFYGPFYGTVKDNGKIDWRHIDRYLEG